MRNSNPPQGSGFQDFFQGTIDDVRIYNRALSAQEVALLYALGSANAAHSNTVTLNTGLVGYWTFDGPTLNWKTNTVGDVSGNGNTGSLVGMSTTTSVTIGKIGQALKFNNSGTQYVDAGAGSSLNISGAGTIAAWVNPADLVNDRWVVGIGDNAGNLEFGLETGRTANKLDTIWGTVGGGFDILYSTASLSLSKWQFVAVTRTGSGSSWTANLYINGALDSTQSGTHAASSFVRAIIGSCANNASCSTQRVNGSIDDVRVYNRALSAQEVGQLYALGNTNAAHSNTVTLSTGLVGYWTFDGPSLNWKTGTVGDVSGNGNTGTLVGMSTTTSVAIGKIGQALKFNGTNQYVSAAIPAINSTQISLCAWASISSNPSVYTEIMGDSASNGAIYVNPSGNVTGQFTFTSRGNVGTVLVAMSTGWHHYCTTWSSGNRILFYKDGSFVSQSTSNVTDTLSSWSGFQIARYTPGTYFPGTIDDVRIYNRALSAQEVQQLYLMGK